MVCLVFLFVCLLIVLFLNFVSLEYKALKLEQLNPHHHDSTRVDLTFDDSNIICFSLHPLLFPTLTAAAYLILINFQE